MRQCIRGVLLASVVAVSATSMGHLFNSSAQAQPVDLSFDAFHDQLSANGDWLYSDRWGEVWRPYQQDQDSNWRPYTVGHWAYTDEYGWTWISDEGSWGDVVYHYGRWVYDPDAGWLWLTGYVWSPAWVVWRSAGPNIGWMPMPPDDGFLGVGGPDVSVGVSFGDWGNVGGFYGYSRWYGPQFDESRFGAMWTFVPTAHVADPVYRNYVVPQQRVVNIIRISQNVTNYTVVNNIVINKSVNVTLVRGAGGKPIAPVHASAVLHNTRWITPVSRGQQVQVQMRQTHPRGNGIANSAPAPTPAQVKGLSSRPIPSHGAAKAGAPSHLFNQAAAAQVQRKGPASAPAVSHPPNKPGGPPNPAVLHSASAPAVSHPPNKPGEPRNPAVLHSASAPTGPGPHPTAPAEPRQTAAPMPEQRAPNAGQVNPANHQLPQERQPPQQRRERSDTQEPRPDNARADRVPAPNAGLERPNRPVATAPEPARPVPQQTAPIHEARPAAPPKAATPPKAVPHPQPKAAAPDKDKHDEER